MKIIDKMYKKLKQSFTRGINENEIDYYTLQKKVKENSSTILLDVRSNKEFNEGHLLGAINIPLAELNNRANLLMPNKGQTIIIYCQMGGRSKKALKLLQKMGYTNLYQLAGGLDLI